MSDLSERSFKCAVDRCRLDKAIADFLGCGRRHARVLLRDGAVFVNDRRTVRAVELALGDRVTIEAAAPSKTTEQEAPLRILAETPSWLALAKAAGVHTHSGRSAHSLAAALAAARPSQASVCDDAREAGIVHRLDRDTSGVVLAAKSAESYRKLRSAFGAGSARKDYLALVQGSMLEPRTIETPLVRLRTSVRAARRNETGRLAWSRIVPLESARDWSLVQVAIRTGVTHQVRAHLSIAGHPILGDTKYGGESAPDGARSGALLHALRIVVEGIVDVSAAVSGDFVRALAALRS